VILNSPLATPASASSASTAQAKERPKFSPPNILFGSRILGPAQIKARQEDIDARSQIINGVKIPPKPTEPDNCCMSGCVHCVWDIYRDDMETWSAAKNAAAAKGGGVEAETEPLFESIPVGIRQFMLTEKMIKERHTAAEAKV
jgi:hypothetical protein